MIEKVKYWCYKILPLVYDDSLSYYEVLCKVTGVLNEVIERVNEIPQAIKDIINDGSFVQELVNEYISNPENLVNPINKVFDETDLLDNAVAGVISTSDIVQNKVEDVVSNTNIVQDKVAQVITETDIVESVINNTAIVENKVTQIVDETEIVQDKVYEVLGNDPRLNVYLHIIQIYNCVYPNLYTDYNINISCIRVYIYSSSNQPIAVTPTEGNQTTITEISQTINNIINKTYAVMPTVFLDYSSSGAEGAHVGRMTGGEFSISNGTPYITGGYIYKDEVSGGAALRDTDITTIPIEISNTPRRTYISEIIKAV